MKPGGFALGLLLALAFGNWAGAQGPGGTPVLEVEAQAVEIRPGKLSGLRLRGAVVLSADHSKFGGFSGLVMNGPRMIAVSDTGWWMLAELEDGPRGLVPRNAGFAPMRDEDGSTFDKAGGDAEGLAVRDGNLVVSFERDHRLMFHIEQGQLGDTVNHAGFERLGSNKGLEALAVSPDGWVFAIAEAPTGKAHPMFKLRHSGEIVELSLPHVEPYFVTGADFGPDGRLYVVLRDYNPFFGVSIAIHRYDLDEDGLPDPSTRWEMAEFDTASGMDNMEAIALWQDGEGMTHLTLLSDDNFNSLQRTLLVDFEVLD